MSEPGKKLLGLFLGCLLLVSVPVGGVELSNVSAAANTTPQVESVTEGDGEISVVFSDSVLNASEYSPIEETDGQFVIYHQGNGSSSFDRYSVKASAVTAAHDRHRFVIDLDSVGIGDITQGTEAKLFIGTVRPESRSESDAQNDVSPGNVSVYLSSAVLKESDSHTERGDALRVYQGTNLLIDADQSGSDTSILLENVDTGEILLDGSTAHSDRLVFATDNLESGTTYKVTLNEFENGGTSQYFNVVSLRASANLAEDGTEFESDETVSLSVTGSAIRGASPARIDITGPEEWTIWTRFNAQGELDISRSYDDLPAGDYTVTVTDLVTGVEVTAGEFSVAEPVIPPSGEISLSVEAGQTYSIGFPGPMEETYGEIFGGVEGTLWKFDASTNEWVHPEADENVTPLDAVLFKPEEDATLSVEFESSSTDTPSMPTDRAVEPGWNFIAPPQYGSVEQAFGAGTAKPGRILGLYKGVGDQPLSTGSDFGVYTFGEGGDPRVSAFRGYWVYMNTDGEIAVNIYPGLSDSEIEDMLSG